MDVGTGFYQQSEQLNRLIDGNAAGNTKDDSFTC
jgi:hypothetical protein